MSKYLGRVDGDVEGSDRLERKGGIYVPSKGFTETHLVLGDTVNTTEAEILANESLPQRGEFKNGCFVVGYTPKELGTIVHPTTHVKTFLWEVTVEYSSNIIDYDATNHLANSPLEQFRPKRRVYTEKEKERLFIDAITSEPVINANGEPLEVETNSIIICLEITRYESDFDMDNILAYCGRTNEKDFYGAPEGSCLLDDISVQEEEFDGRLAYLVTYLFKFKIRIPIVSDLQLMKILDKEGYVIGPPEVNGDGYELDTWAIKPLHQGTKYRKVAGEPPVVFRQSGQPVTVNLRPDGTLSADERDLWYIVFNTVPKTDFTPLNLEY